MTKAQGIKALQRLIGPKLAWRETPRAANADQRAKAMIYWRELREAEKLAREAAERRRLDLLADAEYQVLLKAAKDAKTQMETIGAITRSHRLTVGTNEGIFFSVKAQGDNWADVVRKLEAERQKASA